MRILSGISQVLGLCLTICVFASGTARGQATGNYPERPIKLLVGFSPGGSADAAARLVAHHMSASMGQSIIVENRVGASGLIASEALVRAPADGYTLLLMVSGHATLAAMRNSLPYDPVKDFSWISTITKYPMVVAVAPNSPIKTLEDLVKAAKQQPGKISYASVGAGTAHHLIGEWINAMAGIETTHVPFKGGTQGVTEVMANRVDVDIETITLVQPFIASGKLRGIAVTSRTPVAALPGVPTASQTFRGMEYESWLGVAAPARTPQAIVNKLNGELRKVLALPEVQTKFKQMGAEAHPSSPDEFRSMVLDDIAKFSSIVDARKLPRE